MKQTENMTQYHQNDAFSRRLDNWQSVIGLPNRYYSSPTAEQYRSYEIRGRALQAEAIRESSTSLSKWLRKSIVNAVSATIAGIKKYQKHQRDIRELLSLNDHELKDIGLTRTDVHAFVHNRITVQELNQRRLGLVESVSATGKAADNMNSNPPALNFSHSGQGDSISANDSPHDSEYLDKTA